tara:strand:- start:1337 stop:1483 length:147 start_codon:yes stop_codon:yes gene_type:complete
MANMIFPRIRKGRTLKAFFSNAALFVEFIRKENPLMTKKGVFKSVRSF